jgi:hypothetical protein
MSTITEPSNVSRIQNELKTLSPQELRIVEMTVRDLQKNHAVPEHSVLENSEQENSGFDSDEILEFAKNIDLDDLDFDEDGWLHPKPGAARRLLELCRKHLKSYSDEECEQLRLERILGEKAE